jgi:hypothetical protein
MASGCGRNIQNSPAVNALSTAQAQLDSRQFEKAIETLERIQNTNPQNEEIKIKLFHSYAGAGGFEALKVMGIWLEFEVLFKKFRQYQESNSANQSESPDFTKLVTQIKKLLAPIPKLTNRQRNRLNQAIELYQGLEYKLENAGRYSNFKWGTLHVFRLAVNIKELVNEIDVFLLNDHSIELKEIENIIIPKLKVSAKDILMAYKLFGFSYHRLKIFTESLDKIIASIVKNKDFKLKVNTSAKDENEFFRSLIQDNIQTASILTKKIVNVYLKDDDDEKNLLSKEDLKNEIRLETFIQVLIEKVISRTPDIETRLQSIFNESLKLDFVKATEESLKLNNTDPLKDFLTMKRAEVEILRSYYSLLKKEIQETDLEDHIKDEIRNLNHKVDLEILKDESVIIIDALKRDIRIIKLRTGTVVFKDREQLIKRKTILDNEISELNKFLQNVGDNQY